MSKTAKTGTDDYKKILDSYQDLIASQPPSKPTAERISIEDEIARERKLKNDDIEQDIELKKITLNRLFALLVVETGIIFAFAFLQATHWFGFSLDEWSFKLLTTVTIAQITIMLTVAVNYLFPKKKK
jgi:hypothetical protein